MATKSAHQSSQKNQQVPNLTEDQARAHIEAIRWPNSPVCPHCGSVNVYRMEGKTIRPGLLACRDCRGHFTVMVGTVMEDSHLPLATWVRAFHFMATSKKGMSALQLQRNLGLGSYRTAWHLAHRIREAMRCEPVAGMLKGDVQVDEAYLGPSRHGKVRGPNDPKRKRGRGTDKQPVMVLVETNGKAHSRVIEKVNGAILKSAMEQVIHSSARIVTDECRSYPKAVANFAAHSTVNHSVGEYQNAEGLNTNTAESYFGLLKRGLHGTFHHVSKHHLHRYCSEFDFRWNGRTASDTERRDAAVKGAEGKRLMYKQPLDG
ncbi:MAG TPA: IS1595 family transposase [Tepidisphaeraceae bacterium]|nr:IS1595 family transposase [Tepidisphaeraceae bacterium]